MTTTLKPCPFCGSGNVKYVFGGCFGWGVRIECKECGCRTGDIMCEDEELYADIVLVLVNTWNRRPGDEAD